MADSILYPEFDVLFEGEETTHRAKFVKDKPSIRALMYCAADTNFYIDYDYLAECKKNNKPAVIPMKVIAKQKAWEEEVKKFQAAWIRSTDLNKKSLIIRPQGFEEHGIEKS